MIIEKDELTVKLFHTRAEMGMKAAKEVSSRIFDLLTEKKEINMIFAAAPSQNDFLSALVADPVVEWERINAFHMDEYIGLQPEAPQGFAYFLKERIFDRVPFKTINYINGQAADVQSECERYTSLLKKGKIDIVCLGIGENGHIAFNDPHVANFNDPAWVKVVDLDEKCRRQQVNDGCFPLLEEVPKLAITLTIPALTAATYMYCIVPSTTKAQAVLETIKGDIDEKCPASILRKKRDSMLFLDAQSAFLLLTDHIKE